MNKILKELTNECWLTNETFLKRKGNYKVSYKNLKIEHFYYNHKICEVDIMKMEFSLFYCGYRGYRLTIAQINFLEKFYKEKGYKLVKIYD